MVTRAAYSLAAYSAPGPEKVLVRSRWVLGSFQRACQPLPRRRTCALAMSKPHYRRVPGGIRENSPSALFEFSPTNRMKGGRHWMDFVHKPLERQRWL